MDHTDPIPSTADPRDDGLQAALEITRKLLPSVPDARPPEVVLAHLLSPYRRPWWRRRWVEWAAVGTLAALFAGGIVAYAWWPRTPPPAVLPEEGAVEVQVQFDVYRPDAGKVVGLVGRTAVEAQAGDDLRVTASASRPTHWLVILGRPDGSAERLGPAAGVPDGPADEFTVRLRVDVGGEWRVVVLPLTDAARRDAIARELAGPGGFSGSIGVGEPLEYASDQVWAADVRGAEPPVAALQARDKFARWCERLQNAAGVKVAAAVLPVR